MHAARACLNMCIIFINVQMHAMFNKHNFQIDMNFNLIMFTFIIDINAQYAFINALICDYSIDICAIVYEIQ